MLLLLHEDDIFNQWTLLPLLADPELVALWVVIFLGPGNLLENYVGVVINALQVVDMH
jgi:hypothetical protein